MFSGCVPLSYPLSPPRVRGPGSVPAAPTSHTQPRGAKNLEKSHNKSMEKKTHIIQVTAVDIVRNSYIDFHIDNTRLVARVSRARGIWSLCTGDFLHKMKHRYDTVV